MPVRVLTLSSCQLLSQMNKGGREGEVLDQHLASDLGCRLWSVDVREGARTGRGGGIV